MKAAEQILKENIANVKSKNLSPTHEAKMIAMFEKKYKKSNNKNWKKRDVKIDSTPLAKWEGLSIAEINKMNATENLPSSLR